MPKIGPVHPSSLDSGVLVSLRKMSVSRKDIVKMLGPVEPHDACSQEAMAYLGCLIRYNHVEKPCEVRSVTPCFHNASFVFPRPYLTLLSPLRLRFVSL